MNKPVLALFLYFGLTLFLVVNAISVLRGVSLLTAVERGMLTLAVFAVLGIIAGLASRQEAKAAEEPGE